MLGHKTPRMYLQWSEIEVPSWLDNMINFPLPETQERGTSLRGSGWMEHAASPQEKDRFQNKLRNAAKYDDDEDDGGGGKGGKLSLIITSRDGMLSHY